MRVLAIGALWVPYIRENWFDALQAVLGEQVICVNVAPLLVNKERYSTQPESFHCAYIYDLIRREPIDYLFFYHDWIFADYPDTFFEKIRSAGIKIVTFLPDDEPEVWYQRNTQFDHHYDVIASHSSRGVERRKQSGWKDSVIYLPWGYNQRQCYRLDDSPKSIDIVFFGKHKVNELDDKSYLEDGQQREKILEELATLAKSRGWLFKIFGYGWDKHPTLSEYAGGVPSQEEMVKILNSTKIVFNPAWSSDGTNAVQTKLRHFEVPGCGAFQITNTNSELAELYEPDKEIVFYDNEQALFSKLEYYLENNKEREQIAAAAYQRSLAEHTLDHRVGTLFDTMEKLYPPEKQTSSPLPDVDVMSITSQQALQTFHKQIKDKTVQFSDDQWIHIQAGRFDKLTVSYSTLSPFLKRFPDQILEVSSYIDFEGNLTYNPLQPKLVEKHSTLLDGAVDDEILFPLLGDEKTTILLGIKKNAKIHLLINYIVPGHKLESFLDYFFDTSSQEELATIPTGRIITEAVISVPEYLSSAFPYIDNFEYVKRLRRLLPVFAEQKMRVVIYGISGMGQTTLDLISNITPNLQVIGIVDRSLKSSEFMGIPVFAMTELEQVDMDILILTAGASGPSIYQDINYLEGNVCILPLYDLAHPVWSTMGL
jgi:glycosyltransferase involved in cell wall biosynthesis